MRDRSRIVRSHDIQGLLTGQTPIPDEVKPRHQELPDSISTAFSTEDDLLKARERIKKDKQRLKTTYEADQALRKRITKEDFQLKFIIARSVARAI
jgi:hypothetical protein